MPKTLSTSLEKDVQCVEERENAENVKMNLENESSRPSRRALHRQAVKKFNERRKNEERRRLAEERDSKLIQSSNSSSSNNNNNNSSDSHSEQCSSLKVINKNSTKKPVLIGKWEFDFFFRTIPSELLPSRGESVETDNNHEESPSVLYNKEEQSLVVVNDNDNDNDSRPLKSSVPLKAMMQSNLTKSIHVRRLEGVPPLPMIMPIPTGTDLDEPTRNYLLPDTTYNVHQHAPGFERDENMAKRSMLACAVREWRGGDDNVLVLSTGEALRSVFESTYGEAKPLALEVRRIGPTLLIDSHSERQFRTRVKDMREKALLGKALYRIHDESFSVKGNDSVNPSENGVVALPMHRVGSGALAKETRMLSRYSHIFRWEIGSMDVLVGIDTPIILDHRDNTEYVLKLKDISVTMTPQEVQREALNSWFDATLANVPQVGIYVHNKGVVQQYEVKKAQEMLGRVEGSMATASMNFTTNVLQWLVAQCTKDGVTYAVLRNYATGDLEIYECSKDEHFDKFLPGESKTEGDFITDPSRTDKRNNNDKNNNSHNNNGIDSINTEETTTDQGTKEHHNATENERLNWGLAAMCFRMGMHLKDSEKKASDAFSLLLRSFSLYFQQKTRMEEASQHICDIVKSLPSLIRSLINGRKAELEEQGGIIQLPVVYREAFLACGRFEMRLQEAIYDETLPIPTRRTFLKCLLPCSAALCVCIARTIEQFSAERRVYLRLRAEKNRGSNMHIHSLIAKDLLQVVVEGLLRLEQMNNILKDDSTLILCTSMDQKEHQAALIDTKTEIIDITPLTRASWELYADVVLLVMSDRTPFTANVLVELTRRIKSREDRRNGENVHPSVTVSDGDTTEMSNSISGRGSSSSGDNILTWLSSITHDPVSLSFTALRFLTKVGLESKRLLLKMAQVYYHVGHHHLLTDRYTKSLESLHRAQSLFKAMQQAAADDVFGGCSVPSGTVTIKDVHHALGDVYIRMASLKSHLASVELRLSVQQPLGFGEVRVLSPEEEAFYRHAVDHFTNCEANARLAAVLRVYASRMIGHIVCSGQQADVAKGRYIYSMLRKAGDLSSNDAVLDWEVLRLCTCATHHAALQHRAEEITLQWSTACSFSETNITTTTSTSTTIGMPVVLESIIHPLEYLLQMSLVSLVLLEMKKNMKTHQVMSIVRGCIAQLVVALNGCQETNNNASSALLVRVLATWKARCSHEWMCHMSLMISLRAMRVLMRLLPTGKTSGPKGVMQELVNIQKEMDDFVRTDICSGDECQFSKLATSLVRVLEGVTKW